MANELSLQPDAVPLHVDEGGVVRLGSGRISLDPVVQQFKNGMTPEDLVRACDSLVLADVYYAGLAPLQATLRSNFP